MEGLCAIEFDDLEPEAVEQLKEELTGIDGVEEVPRMRGLDLATMQMGVMTAGAAIALVQQVGAIIKRKKDAQTTGAEAAVSGEGATAGPKARITLPNGTVIELDGNTSPEQLQQLVGVLGG